VGGFGEDLAVGESMQPFVSEMDGVMPLVPEPLDHTDIHAHVGQEAHSGLPLRCPYLLLREPGRVAQGLFDVRSFEIRVSCEDFFEGCTVGNLTDDDRDRNPHAADACATTQDLWIEGNSVERRHREAPRFK
jgi:hypothetical protein